MKRLSPEERCAEIERLNGWTFDERREAIAKSFSFGDFVEAFGFISKVALLAERSDHHPEWSNVYKHVHVCLTTHEAKGVTLRDTELAAAIDQLAAVSIFVQD